MALSFHSTLALSRALPLAALLLLAACGKSTPPPPVTARPAPSAPTVVAAPAPAAAAPAAPAVKAAPTGFQLVLEAADSKQLSGAWQVFADPKAAHGKCVGAKLGEGKTPETAGKLTLTATLPVAGKAQVWVRAQWKGSCSNSVLLSFPGIPEQIVGKDATYDKWHWVRGPVLPLPAGDLTFALNERQDDVRFDQVLLTTNLDYVPVDIE